MILSQLISELQKLQARLKSAWAQFLRHRREQQCLKKCGNVTYCPRCREILTDKGRVLDDSGGVVTMQCPCGLNSRWLFDAPCPILLPES